MIFISAINILKSQQTFALMKISWRRLEDVLRLRLQKTSTRRLDKDEYIDFSHTSSEDIFKTPWSRRIYSSWWYILKTSSFKTFCQDVFKTSWRHQDPLERCLQDSFKTFSRRITKLNCCCHVFKTSSRRTQHVFGTYCEDN